MGTEATASPAAEGDGLAVADGEAAGDELGVTPELGVEAELGVVAGETFAVWLVPVSVHALPKSTKAAASAAARHPPFIS